MPNNNSVTVRDKYIQLPYAGSEFKQHLSEPAEVPTEPEVAEAAPAVESAASVTDAPFELPYAGSNTTKRLSLPFVASLPEHKAADVELPVPTSTGTYFPPIPGIGKRLPNAVLPSPRNPSIFTKVGIPSDDVQFFVPHGDEQTAHQILNDYYKTGGTGEALVSNAETRNGSLKVDPNQTWRLGADDPSRKSVEDMLNSGPQKLTVALHNTRGGALSNELNRSTAVSKNDPAYGGYILTTDPGVYDSLKSKPYNVILQVGDGGQANDYSTSRWAAVKGNPYVNIEAQRGDFQKQKAMLGAALAAWKSVKSGRVIHAQASGSPKPSPFR